MKFEQILRVTELREVESLAAHHPLMERAGLAAAGVARDMLGHRNPAVLVMAGRGNNGGDAFVVARCLAAWFHAVVVVFDGDAERLPRAAATAYRAWVEAGGHTVAEWPQTRNVGLIVDGLFGIGLSRRIDGAAADWIERANASGIPILALDIPSGLSADSGQAQAPTIRAAATSTFIALKPGLLTADGPDYCGSIHVHDLGLADSVEAYARGYRLDWEVVDRFLPEAMLRGRSNVSKGSFGSLAIVGGNDGMVGAAVLAGRAALHAGVGKIWLGLAATDRPAVDWMHPELMLRTSDDVPVDAADAIVVGPGLGTDQRARGIAERCIAANVPLLIDADALNLLAANPSLFAMVAQRMGPTVITPHPGEAARLMQSTTTAIQSDRMAAAAALATRLRATVVLKGAGTVVVDPDGAFAINATGGPSLSSGGTGDVLSGLLGALIAQHVAPFDAAKIAVCLHGAAADALAAGGDGPTGLTAGELAPMARRLINQARRT